MSDRLAILIGNGRFDGEQSLPELPGVSHDMASLGQLLSDPEAGNFVVFESLDRESGKLQPELDRAFALGHAGATVLVYYGGYVLADPGRGLFLATADTVLANLKNTAIPLSSIKGLLRSSRSRNIVVILDCCYVGPSGRVDEIEIEQQLRRIRTEVGPDVHVIASPASIQRPEARETTAGDGPRGLLTATIVEGLITGAADRDGDNRTGARDLNDYLGMRLSERRPLWTGPLEGADPEILSNPHPIAGVDLEAFRERGAKDGSRRWRVVGAVASVAVVAAAVIGLLRVGEGSGPRAARVEEHVTGTEMPESVGLVGDLGGLRSLVSRTGWVEHIEPLDGSGPRFAGAVTLRVDPGARARAGTVSLGLLNWAEMEFGPGVHGVGVETAAAPQAAEVDVELADGRLYRFDVGGGPEASEFFAFVSREPIRRARISSTSVRFVALRMYVYSAEEFDAVGGLRY